MVLFIAANPVLLANLANATASAVKLMICRMQKQRKAEVMPDKRYDLAAYFS